MSTESHINARVHGGVGRITLNRPRALNALDLGMIRGLRENLDRWADNPGVRLVVLDGAGDRGFCAGGDVRALREQILSDDLGPVATFFREEYELNALIAEYPEPIVAIADGVTMGGGIGLAGHARERIVTERSMLAMPETAIGFTPDVGGSLLLARAPGRLGEYLALTGRSVGAADAIAVGLADYAIDSNTLGSLVDALEAGAGLADALRSTSGPAEPAAGTLEAARDWIDAAFAAESVPAILSELRVSEVPEALETAEALERLSPTSLAVTLESVRRARELDELRAVLAQEFRLAMWFAQTRSDMPEGIRAVLVDRDRSPRWSPETVEDLPATVVDEAFAFVPQQAGPWATDRRDE